MMSPDFLLLFNMNLRIIQTINEILTISTNGKIMSFGTNSYMLTEYENMTGKIASKNG